MADIQPRAYGTVTLTCYEADGVIVVLDSRGKRLAVTSKTHAKIVPQESIIASEHRRMWSLSANGWMGSRNSTNHRMSRSCWDKKASMWLGVVRMRRNRTRPLKIRKTDRQCVRWQRSSWDDAIRCMEYQFRNRTYKERTRQSNPWILWAETVAGNLRTRGTRYVTASSERSVLVGHEKRIASQARAAAIQMRIEW